MDLTRDQVEVAIDRFIELGERLKPLGKAESYFVRSSRTNREGGPFSTKPIAILALHRSPLEDFWGGWGYGKAATILHNAGFVIVDERDNPHQVPDEKYNCQGVDRIALCATNYFIAPARENGKERVKIRVGELCEKMGSSHDVVDVHRALAGETVRQLGKVSVLTMARVGDADSSFVFELSAPTAEDLRREFEDITRHLPQETEVERLEVKRIGQQKFREGLMYRWNCRCPLTGIEDSELLTASHIKPWRDSDNDERLDPDNGFLFSALWDAAFDRGLVTFGDDGEPRFSDGLSDRACKQLRWKRALQLTNRNREYLVWHRERVFQR